MTIEITMPRLSDTMEQGTIISWNVKEGDEVAAGDILGDIETDKATMELQNFDDGIVALILLAEGMTTQVGSIMAVLAEDGEDPAAIKQQYESGGGGTSAQAAPAEVASAEPPTTAAATNGAVSSAPVASTGRVIASPLAKKIAEEKGIDLSTITGTGPGGRIVKKDVESATPGSPSAPAAPVLQAAPQTVLRRVETPAPAAAPPAPSMELAPPSTQLADQTFAVSNMRNIVESKTTIPHYQVTVTAAMDTLLDLRKSLNAQLASQNVKLSVNDFLVRACGLAMHQHPFINASWGEESGGNQSINIHGRVNIGVAIAMSHKAEGGLVVATIRDADRIGLRQISAETKRLAIKSREKGLTIEEMSDSTFTISNLGMFGVEHFTAIINPPNSAILAVGGAVQKPVVRDGAVVPGWEMQMTMSSDHRVIDGAMAAQYLNTVREYLENPAGLLV